MSSISRRFLIAIGSASVSITLIAAVAVMIDARADLAQRQQREIEAVHGVVGPDGPRLVAPGRTDEPDRHLPIKDPRDAPRAAAARDVLRILAFGLAGAAAQAALILWLTHRYIVTPLRALASTCLPQTPKDAQSRALEHRTDEIGRLARALTAERAASQLVQSSLEERVLERTSELERASQEKSRFLANMSHELRTPLNGIIAVSEKLRDRQTDSDGRELAELIVDSGRLLERVLSDILDFSRFEAGEVALVEETLNLGALVERVGRLHQTAAQAKTLELTWSISPDCGGRHLGDGVRIAQVLSNLVGNAVKFTNAGWVDIRVEGAPDDNVRFTVSDTGVGFGPEVEARLFQRVEQAETPSRSRSGDAGLGLAICRTLVDAMGGEITCRSRPGMGSAFTFTLPMRSAATGEALPAAAAAATSSPVAGARVLLAEDHPTHQKVVSLILDAAGAFLTVVDDGQAALDALERETFDLVLMDVQMPLMDGLTAVRLIRERERQAGTARLPIAMLTANALKEHAAESLKAGADRHISKPIRSDELVSVAGELLEAAARSKSRQAA